MNAEKIIELFFYRDDVFALQLDKGMYIPVKRKITVEDVNEHLRGEKTLGAYCLRPDNTIKWVCVDLDGEDLDKLYDEAKQIYDCFPDFPRIMEFSGRRGYHVWIFFTPPVKAVYGKKVVTARMNKIGLGGYEVFPKQTELNEGRLYGNLVKIPLALHRVSKKRSEIIFIEGL